ncbi:VCBS repeat-containing protein [bacterium]|nr:VCBS repeat-containing protein [bacterium]
MKARLGALLFMCAVLAFTSAGAVAHAAEDFGWVPQSIQAIDYQDDGRFDLAVAYAFTDNVAVIGTDPVGNETLLYTTEVGLNDGILNDLPRQLLVRDFTKDGVDDILVLCSGNPNALTRSSIQVLRGSANAGFIPLPAQMAEIPTGEFRFPTCIDTADLNGDGLLDLIVGNTYRNSFTQFNGVGFGQFEFEGERITPDGTGVTDVALVDLNADRQPDLVFTTYQSLWVGLAAADGSFPSLWQVSQEFSGTLLAFAVGDVDESGRPDIVTTTDSGGVTIFHDLNAVGQSFARRQEMPLHSGAFLSDVALLDWTRDGRMEIAVLDKHSNEAVILFPDNSIAPLWLPIPAAAPRRMAVADLDGDGTPDIATANEGDQDDFPNPDVSRIYNSFTNSAAGDLVPDGVIRLRPLFPGSIEMVGATGAGLLGLSWVFDTSTQELAGFDPEGNRIETLHIVGAGPGSNAYVDPSGLAFESATGGRVFLLDEANSRIRQYLLSGDELRPLGSIAIANHEGLSGLVYEQAAQRFWTIDTVQQRVLVLEEDGSPAMQFDIGFPADLIALEYPGDKVYLSRRGGGRIIEFAPGSMGIMPTGNQFFLPQFAPELREDAIAGIAWNSPAEKLIVTTWNRAMATLTLPEPPDASNPFGLPEAKLAPLSRGGRIEALAIDRDRNELLILDRDGIPSVIVTGLGGDLRRVLELDVHGDPNNHREPSIPFEPATIAWDPLHDEIVVGDRWSTRFIVLSPAGDMMGSIQWNTPGTAADSTWPPFTGLEIDDQGDFRLRSQSGILTARRDGTIIDSTYLATQDAGDLAGDGTSLFGLAPADKRLDQLAGNALDANSVYLNYLANPAETLTGLATAEGASLFLVGAPAPREVHLLRRTTTTAAEPAWAMYE